MLYSDGYFTEVIDDICDDMKFDIRHSYDDNIMSVEEVREKYHDRITILCDIDVNFICREIPKTLTGAAGKCWGEPSITVAMHWKAGTAFPFIFRWTVLW